MKNSFSIFKVLMPITILFYCTIVTGQSKNEIISFKHSLNKKALEKPGEPLRVMKDNGPVGVEFEYQFSNGEVSSVIADSTNYNYIHIKGFTKMSQVGAPALPSHYDNIAVPLGAKCSVSITETEYIEYKGYYIHPALRPAIDAYGYPEPEFEIDEEIYNSDTFFPENIINISTGKKYRGTTIASVQIVPVQFNPVTKTIRVYSKIKYTIAFEKETRKSLSEPVKENSIDDTKKLKNVVLNNKQFTLAGGYRKTADAYEDNEILPSNNYIIITHPQYLAAAQKLAEWKSQLGYGVEIVSQSSWNSDQVKAAIHSRYESYIPKPDYFVIIGDHTGPFAVPGEIHYDPRDLLSATDLYFATDLYYACMDGVYDYVPDMAHGRISVSSPDEAMTVVDKIINYEKNPPLSDAFYSNITHCAFFEDFLIEEGYADKRFAQTAEEALQYMIGKGYTGNRVYAVDTIIVNPLFWNNDYFSNGEEIPEYLKRPTFDWDGDKNDIANEVNAGRFLVLHRDHGYEEGLGWMIPEFLTSDIDLLSNGNLLPVLFSINCFTGEYQQAQCFAEGWLRAPDKGAVGVVAAAYSSYSGYNDAFTSGLYDAIWPGWQIQFTGTDNEYNPPYPEHDPVYTMGDVLNQGLLRMTESWGNWWGYEKCEFELFHWFGDPAMRIWTSNPNNSIIIAMHNNSIACDETIFSITNSVAGSIATLVYEDILIGKTVLDNSGNGTIHFNITPAVGTKITLTISKQNCKPYIAEINVTGNCIFPPLLLTSLASYISPTTATIGGNIQSDGGSIISESGIIYSLTPNVSLNSLGSIKVPTDPVVDSGSISLDISGLNEYTTYYYKTYAINDVDTSYGDELKFQTLYSVNNFPYTVDFENSLFLDYWTQKSGRPRWMFMRGCGDGLHPPTAHGGLYNACLIDLSVASNRNKLTSPSINLTSISNPTLRFWHTQELFLGRQDELRIYYKTSTGGEWNLLATYTDNISTWTMETISLPDPGSDYYIAFEGDARHGFGVCIDDIIIYSRCLPPTIQSNTFTSSAITKNSATIGWTRGNGDNVLVVAKAGSPVDAEIIDGTSYTANTVFGSGQQIGTGNYVVYNGQGTSVNVTGLSPYIIYYFAIYEYNSATNCYLITPLTGKVATSCNSITFPYNENFSFWPPACWDLTGGTFDWDQYIAYSPAARAKLETQTDNYALMTTPVMNFSALENPELIFKWSHMFHFRNLKDELRIEITTDGSTWNTIWDKVGPDFNSNVGGGCGFPGLLYASDTIDLRSYAGQAFVQIRFKAISGHGCSIFIDNVLINGITTQNELYGDANCDGTVDLVDASLTAQYYIGFIDGEGTCIEQLCDVNQDGIIDIIDALVIAQYYEGIVPWLPLTDNTNKSLSLDKREDALKEFNDLMLSLGQETISVYTETKLRIYPNPLNDFTNIEIWLPKAAKITLEIQDITGRTVEQLFVGHLLEKGMHKVLFNSANLANGIYLCRLRVDDEKEACYNKMVIQK